jgi:hypothetical protein
MYIEQGPTSYVQLICPLLPSVPMASANETSLGGSIVSVETTQRSVVG